MSYWIKLDEDEKEEDQRGSKPVASVADAEAKYDDEEEDEEDEEDDSFLRHESVQRSPDLSMSLSNYVAKAGCELEMPRPSVTFADVE